MSQDTYAQQLKSMGVDEGMARAYAESTVDTYGKLQNLNGRTLAEVMKAQVDEAKRTADAAAAREKLNSSRASGTSASSNASSGQTAGYGNIVKHEYVVKVPTTSGTSSINVADESSAQELVRVLQQQIAAQA